MSNKTSKLHQHQAKQHKDGSISVKKGDKWHLVYCTCAECRNAGFDWPAHKAWVNADHLRRAKADKEYGHLYVHPYYK